MHVLAFDVGSSSVKAGLLRGGKIVGQTARAEYPTRYTADRAEVSADAITTAIGRTIHALGAAVKRADVIAMTAMAPSWIAMDRRGRALTPLVTHQDRRSVKEAHDLIERVGKSRLLHVTGNLPFPGGISSTTWLWFTRHAKALMKKADLVGHLQTYLQRQLNGARIVDPSNASFMGLYRTLTLNGWSDELCALVGATEHQLPQLIDAAGVAGMVTRAASSRFGLTHGTPMMVGCIDTSAAMLLADSKVGQLLNVAGSTDVLALCTDRPIAHEHLLTRAVGTGRRWMSVSTLAAAGSALNWAKDQLFSDLTEDRFFTLVSRLTPHAQLKSGGVGFDPFLAGDRTSIDQRRGAFSGLTLSTTREQMLAAMVDALAKASAARLALLEKNPVAIDRHVMLAGGGARSLRGVLHRDWPGRWRFRFEDEATLRGLARLAEE